MSGEGSCQGSRLRLRAATARLPRFLPERVQHLMDNLLVNLVWLIDQLIGLYIFVIIVGVILSWLVAFNVVNTRNRFVYLVGDFTHRLTEPALAPIRRFMPDLGGVDVSPVILILLLYFVRRLLCGYVPLACY